MLTVITVLKASSEYTSDKVKTVQGMVARHLTIPHEFICLSDVQIPDCRVIPLAHNWKTWYAKMEMFRSDLPEGPKLYLDLDTVIVSNIDSVVEAALKTESDFVILRDFYRGSRNKYAMGSGLMFWRGDYSPIYKSYAANPIQVPGGDQVILERMLDPRLVAFWQDITEGVCSYKVHVRPHGRVLDKYSIVCFHGQPRPWDPTSLLPYK